MKKPEVFEVGDLKTYTDWRWLMEDFGHIWFFIDDTYWFLFPLGRHKYGLCYYEDSATGNFPRWIFNSEDMFLKAKLFKGGTCVLDRLGEFKSYEPEV